MYRKPKGNFQIVNIQKRNKHESLNLKEIRLEKLWPNGQMLSKEKVKDLSELLAFLPQSAQRSYSFLENVAQGDFLDDVDGFGENLDFELE